MDRCDNYSMKVSNIGLEQTTVWGGMKKQPWLSSLFMLVSYK